MTLSNYDAIIRSNLQAAFKNGAAELSARLGIESSAADEVAALLGGGVAAEPFSGDCALILEPLPKVRLCYLLYRPDEDFPANATCLFSANADRFLPTDALADVAEYTTHAMTAALGRGLR